MSGVGLTGKIVPLNGGNFPVFEDINGEGGLRTVADIVARNLISSGSPLFCKEGMLVYCKSTQCIYQLRADLTTWLFFAASPALASQANWAVDIATGNDNNSGLPGSPLASSEELSRRLCPNGTLLTINQNTVVSFATGAYGRLQLLLASPTATSFSFIINCAFTSTADMALTTVVNTNNATLVRGQLTVSSGAFTNQARIRSTSGANIGAIAYSSGQNTSPQNHFVGPFFNYATFGTPNIANATNVAVDTLGVSFADVEVNFSTTFGFFELHDAKLLNGASTNANINLVGCELTGNFYGGCRIEQCRMLGAVSFNAGEWQFYGCAQQTNNVGFFCGALAGYNLGCLFDGAGVLARQGANLSFAGQTEWENGAGGTALQTNAGATIVIGAKQWGNAAAPGSAYAGYVIGPGSQMSASTVAFLAIPVSVAAAAISMAGQSFSYSDFPIAIPESACSFSVNGPDAQGISTTGRSVQLPAAARGNVGLTNIFAANPRAAMFRVIVYLTVTVAGTLGVPLVQIKWTDPSGVAQTQTVPFLTALNVTALGGAGGSIVIRTNGASQVQYSVIGVTTQGALQYQLDIDVRIENPN